MPFQIFILEQGRDFSQSYVCDKHTEQQRECMNKDDRMARVRND